MADIAEQSGNFVVERHMPADGDADFDIINLLSAKKSVHEGLFGQLVVHADVKDFVTVYARADRQATIHTSALTQPRNRHQRPMHRTRRI